MRRLKIAGLVAMALLIMGVDFNRTEYLDLTNTDHSWVGDGSIGSVLTLSTTDLGSAGIKINSTSTTMAGGGWISCLDATSNASFFISTAGVLDLAAAANKGVDITPSNLTGGGTRLQSWGDVNGTFVMAGNGADPPGDTGGMGKVSRTAQAAAIAATNLTNGTLAGLYEVTFYASTTTANVTDGTIGFQIDYTDRVGATNQASAGTLTLAAVSTGTTALNGTFTLYLASGSITYQTNLTGAQTTSRYALEVRCKFLG